MDKESHKILKYSDNICFQYYMYMYVCMNQIIKDLFALILSSFINYNTMSILYYF